MDAEQFFSDMANFIVDTFGGNPELEEITPSFFTNVLETLPSPEESSSTTAESSGPNEDSAEMYEPLFMDPPGPHDSQGTIQDALRDDSSDPLVSMSSTTESSKASECATTAPAPLNVVHVLADSTDILQTPTSNITSTSQDHAVSSVPQIVTLKEAAVSPQSSIKEPIPSTSKEHPGSPQPSTSTGRGSKRKSSSSVDSDSPPGSSKRRKSDEYFEEGETRVETKIVCWPTPYIWSLPDNVKYIPFDYDASFNTLKDFTRRMDVLRADRQVFLNTSRNLQFFETVLRVGKRDPRFNGLCRSGQYYGLTGPKGKNYYFPDFSPRPDGSLPEYNSSFLELLDILNLEPLNIGEINSKLVVPERIEGCSLLGRPVRLFSNLRYREFLLRSGLAVNLRRRSYGGMVSMIRVELNRIDSELVALHTRVSCTLCTCSHALQHMIERFNSVKIVKS